MDNFFAVEKVAKAACDPGKFTNIRAPLEQGLQLPVHCGPLKNPSARSLREDKLKHLGKCALLASGVRTCTRTRKKSRHELTSQESVIMEATASGIPAGTPGRAAIAGSRTLRSSSCRVRMVFRGGACV